MFLDEKHKEVITESLKLFMKYGIKSPTMDDVANNLRMSKKTLYKYCSNKKDLVNQCVSFVVHQEEERTCHYKELKHNAIESHFIITEMASELIRNTHPSVFFDLKKYFPEAWHLLETHRKSSITEKIQFNLQKGIEEGLYRNDLNFQLVVSLYANMVDTMFHYENIQEMGIDYPTMFLEITRFYIRGIASDKGLEVLKKKVELEKNKLS